MNTEEECVHLKDMCEKSQGELQELAEKYQDQLKEVKELQDKLAVRVGNQCIRSSTSCGLTWYFVVVNVWIT